MDLGNVQGPSRGGASGSRGAGGARPRGNKIVCYHCGKTGHIKRQCYKLHGKPQGRGGAVLAVEAGG